MWARRRPPPLLHAAARRTLRTGPPYTYDCVKFEDVVRASHRIRGGVVRTPMVHSHWLSKSTGCDLHLKMEQLQFTGSFKERGGRNALLEPSMNLP